MLSNQTYNSMNGLATKRNRENERRLLEELERISSDKHRPTFLPDSMFNQESFDYGSPMLSGLNLDTEAHESGLALDLNGTGPTSAFADFDPHPASVQVDHTGKMLDFPSSAWLGSTVSSFPGSACVSSSSSSVDKPAGALNACVAAAAVTAAMIVIPENNSLKRPRSSSSLSSRAEEVPDQHTDDSLSSTSDQSQDPVSPRNVQGFRSTQAPELLKIQNAKQQGLNVAAGALPNKGLTLRPNSTKITPSETKPSTSTTTNAASDAESKRKRRAEAMERFRRKKAVRSYARRVRYQVRKRIATTRPRVNGRFARRIDAINHAAKTTK